MTKPLPPHLQDMTQAKWDALPLSRRLALRDESEMHPALVPFIGKKVRVTPKRSYGPSTFRVGITTGWRPVLLAMRTNAHSSSDIIRADEPIETVRLA